MMKQTSRNFQPSGEIDSRDVITPRQRRQRVKVPMRIVESPFYADAALSVYIKVKALAQRPEGCTAGARTLASYLGLSKSTVERGISQLRSGAPDNVIELPENTRRSMPGGWGTTCLRRVRPMTSSERFVWLPVAASEDLTPRQLRAYAVIAYAVAQKIALTETELAAHLRHHSGSRAGRPITTEAAGKVIDALETTGWVTVDRRAGTQGRHLFTLATGEPAPRPGDPFDLFATPGSSVVDDGSGSRVDDGSLAYKEDLMTDRPENERPLVSPAVGEVPVGTAAGSPATGPMEAVRPAETARSGESALPGQPAAAQPSPPRLALRADGHPDTHAPELTYSPRVHAALEPVRWLLPGANTFTQRLIGREVGRQLRTGTDDARLRGRLTARLAATSPSDIRDVGRWLLGVALPRWGCADPDCETGVLWSSGAPCRTCREVITIRRAASHAPAGRPPTVPAPRASTAPTGPALLPRFGQCCPGCERPRPVGMSGLCGSCGHTSQAATPIALPAQRCTSDGTAHCDRPAVSGGLCWRCRVQASSPTHTASTAALTGPVR
ncbi:hypothetical protein ABZW30_40635 [Kitasatospora sp. NPDC004669]|uniref:hypothetical protein n=1 Tax=Kitasatospora sp. NPDC004669 TaxID=3154555 RepID=UPI0033BF5CF7